VPPGRADREDGALDTVIGNLRDNEHSVTSDIRRWHGSGGGRTSDRLAQQSAPGHAVSRTSANIAHCNPPRGEARSRGAGSAGQGGERCTHHSQPLGWGGEGEPLGWVLASGQEGSAAEQGACSWRGGGCPVPISGWAPLSQSCFGSIPMGRGVNGCMGAEGLWHAGGQ